MMRAQRQGPIEYFRSLSFLKQLFWLYFLLLIFEGALRKWVVPQLSAPLLLVRDPVGMLILWEAFRSNKWPERWSALTGFLAVLLLSLFLAQGIAGDNPWFVGLYGLRSYLLPFPVAFVMGDNIDREDLRRFGTCTLWILLPLTLLECAQYLAPANSFLNAGAYKGAKQIEYVEGHTRASGTFSYVIGPINYGPMAAAFLLYGLLDEKFAKRWLLWAASFALVLSVPVIGARTLVYELAGVILCVAIAALCGMTQFFDILKIAVPLLFISFLVSLLPIFSEASTSLNQRFRGAASSEGNVTQSLDKRTVLPYIDALEETDFSSNPIGTGMGRGAAAISQVSRGSAKFATGEDEFSRELIELGPFPGLAFMLIRVIFCIGMAVMAIKRAREREPLALLLYPLFGTSVLFAVSEQPTSQGFMVIGTAFALASLRLSVPRVRVVQREENRVHLMRYSHRA